MFSLLNFSLFLTPGKPPKRFHTSDFQTRPSVRNFTNCHSPLPRHPPRRQRSPWQQKSAPAREVRWSQNRLNWDPDRPRSQRDQVQVRAWTVKQMFEYNSHNASQCRDIAQRKLWWHVWNEVFSQDFLAVTLFFCEVSKLITWKSTKWLIVNHVGVESALLPALPADCCSIFIWLYAKK